MYILYACTNYAIEKQKIMLCVCMCVLSAFVRMHAYMNTCTCFQKYIVTYTRNMYNTYTKISIQAIIVYMQHIRTIPEVSHGIVWSKFARIFPKAHGQKRCMCVCVRVCVCVCARVRGCTYLQYTHAHDWQLDHLLQLPRGDIAAISMATNSFTQFRNIDFSTTPEIGAGGIRRSLGKKASTCVCTYVCVYACNILLHLKQEPDQGPDILQLSG
jgi:hypothetical protein